MMIIYDDHHMMIIYDDHTRWSCMMIIYGDHIWWSYMMIIYDDHTWWSFMMITYVYIVIIYDDHLGVIWESCGSHLEVIWETFGSHLGSIWEPFGIHLETSGRMEAEEASGGQISYHVPHSRTECKSSIKLSIFLGIPLKNPKRRGLAATGYH